MNRYEELMRKSDDCMDAAMRCIKNCARDKGIDMVSQWRDRAWELYDMARALPVEAVL